MRRTIEDDADAKLPRQFGKCSAVLIFAARLRVMLIQEARRRKTGRGVVQAHAMRIINGIGPRKYGQKP